MFNSLRTSRECMFGGGPDDEGAGVDPSIAIGLGFRRLAIFNLSTTGQQPMRSAAGRYVIVFNGEIYSFRELRAEPQRHGVRFRSCSGTEVILEEA